MHVRVILGAILIIAGVYLLLISLSPLWLSFALSDSSLSLPASSTVRKTGKNTLHIPAIRLQVPYTSGYASVLEKGAWWRSPDSGNPKDGGNFVLAAHRFRMGWTPAGTARQSPLYHIDKLSVGDEIIVGYEGVRYTYEITKIHRVTPKSIEIEAPTEDSRLTLYSCTLGGSSDGREVIIAHQK